jgi:uncharacterized membrane protein YhaH (DUF805 family)
MLGSLALTHTADTRRNIVSFQEAVTTVYTQKYVDFSGRARRSEYWFAWLAAFLVSIVITIIGRILDTQVLSYLFDLAILLPGLGVAIRRLHDTGKSGWWMLIALTGVGVIVLIIFFVMDSQPGTNQYGPSPKGGAAFDPAPNPSWGQS